MRTYYPKTVEDLVLWLQHHKHLFLSDKPIAYVSETPTSLQALVPIDVVKRQAVLSVSIATQGWHAFDPEEPLLLSAMNIGRPDVLKILAALKVQDPDLKKKLKLVRQDESENIELTDETDTDGDQLQTTRVRSRSTCSSWAFEPGVDNVSKVTVEARATPHTIQSQAYNSHPTFSYVGRAPFYRVTVAMKDMIAPSKKALVEAMKKLEIPIVNGSTAFNEGPVAYAPPTQAWGFQAPMLKSKYPWSSISEQPLEE